MWITSSLTTAITPTAIALGNFDGVHLGHQAVIQQISAQVLGLDPADLIAPGSTPAVTSVSAPPPLRGLSHRTGQAPGASPIPDPTQRERDLRTTPIPTVMTFFPHPQEFFSGQSRPALTPITEKAAMISQLGVGQLVLLPFTQALANLTPQEFVEDLLVKQLKVQHISVGKDFCFGKKRQGTVDDLQRLTRPYGVDVHITPHTCLGGERISSSRIRAALSQADLATAEALLGRPYSLSGRVVKGQQLGRTLGFPTANLAISDDKFLPPHGVYSVWVEGASPVAGQRLPGVMNLGIRPTVKGLSLTLEVHLLHWSGDLYGKSLQVFLNQHLRSEQRFSSLDALKAQIEQDCQTALAALAKTPVGNWG
ncbi:riboflavin biosynthesis protein RibF [Leptolyngbya sp. BL0902]|uniref:bifunctional riboflavin kinase/FAD synthetase n=1 Tax=Leptolyngbya sp. BL0902 TaxID=1115757 RepID=UPI0018E86247|nr:bifunctional riboflavin kinase/FAD synthetase [Leptolyngbya sp. BL0902]QQE67054.1 riboflavin biosynthesis protein RibF [Leptolyngbya sp. BL0902]